MDAAFLTNSFDNDISIEVGNNLVSYRVTFVWYTRFLNTTDELVIKETWFGI